MRSWTRTCAAAIASVAIAVSAPAQARTLHSAAGSECVVTPAVASPALDVCQKVVDIFAFLSPQIGVALAGGNPMMGEGGTLGGLGKFSLSVHASIVDGRVPSKAIALNLTGGAVASDFGAQRAPVPVPSADAAIGVFKGLTVGLTNVGGIDVLVGASYVPNVNKEPVALHTDDGALAFAYGVRVGLLQESALVPGVSVSLKQRKFPTTSFVYTPNNDTLTVKGASLSTQSLRLVAAKRFVAVGIAAGLGRDKIKAKSDFAGVVNEPAPIGRLSVTRSTAHQDVTRNNAFADISFGLAKANLNLELGYSSAGEIQQTVNSFGDRKANEGYRYGSVGVGFRF